MTMVTPEKLNAIPDKPGVYLMKNAAGDIIYVGKAISLKNRVRSYFQSKGKHDSPKVRLLVKQIADIDYIVTSNEVEALILESTLIKEQKPRYNVRLKDDKNYPYIKVTTDEAFPRVIVTRRLEEDGRMFGPFADAGAVRMTLSFLRKHFPLRTCSLNLSERRDYRPCLLYHIGRCGAPCAGLQSAEEYNKLVEEVCLFLEGRHDRLIPEIERQMKEAAANLQFERAARLRDQMRAIQRIAERQQVVSPHLEDSDVIGVAREGAVAGVQIFFIRGGKLIGQENYYLDAEMEEDRVEILRAFLKQFYAGAAVIPPVILVPDEVEDAAGIADWLSERRGKKVRLHVPKRGEKRRLVEMAMENAAVMLNDYLSRENRRVAANQMGLEQLQELLGLPDLPRRIEAYDISNLFGTDAVGSMVVLTDGVPDNKEYRRFKIRTVQGSNDYAMMQEVIRRRFMRGLKEREEIQELSPKQRAEAMKQARFASFPDLIIIDGGRGQLNAARAALRDLALEDLPMVGLAERLEEIYTVEEDEPIRLPDDSPALHLMQRVRDEAHRFALSYHRHLRSVRARRSVLDEIPGIGPKRKKALLQKFGSVKALRQASVEEMASVPGISLELAQRIHNQLS